MRFASFYVAPPMPKKTRRKDSDYLRFRPYHAFTSPAIDPVDANRRTALWRAVLIAGAVVLLAAATLWLWLR